MCLWLLLTSPISVDLCLFVGVRGGGEGEGGGTLWGGPNTIHLGGRREVYVTLAVNEINTYLN